MYNNRKTQDGTSNEDGNDGKDRNTKVARDLYVQMVDKRLAEQTEEVGENDTMGREVKIK